MDSRMEAHTSRTGTGLTCNRIWEVTTCPERFHRAPPVSRDTLASTAVRQVPLISEISALCRIRTVTASGLRAASIVHHIRMPTVSTHRRATSRKVNRHFRAYPECNCRPMPPQTLAVTGLMSCLIHSISNSCSSNRICSNKWLSNDGTPDSSVAFTSYPCFNSQKLYAVMTGTHTPPILLKA